MKRIITAVLLLLLVTTTGFAQQERDRSKIPDKYKWNLADIYPTDEAWTQAKDKLVAQLPTVGQFRGKLGNSAQDLLAALDARYSLAKDMYRLYGYAEMSSDQDTRDAKYQAMRQQIMQIMADFQAAGAYMEPEILKIDKAKVEQFIAQEPKLKVYQHYLEDLLRRQAHTGTEGEERIIANAGPVANSPSNIYGVFADAEFPYPTVTLSDGKTITIDKAAYTGIRSSRNREDRAKVFSTFFGQIGKFKGTFGAEMSGNVQRDIFYAKARNYKSALESALDANNIPTSVYYNLIDGVNANLPTLHRYLKLRQRMLGVDQLHYYDLYAPIVGDVELTYPIDQAEKNILAAVAPLGKDYQEVIQKAFNERWIDLYPNTGKRSGAYSEGIAYDVHPFMLINYNGAYDDMSTVAHELGHTMQSYFSNKTQPFATADYPIFVAEVASTFNEALLLDSTLKQVKDDQTRLAILGNYLEGARLTMFRQTSFAEFELKMHEMAEKGEPLTGEALDNLYMSIVKKYYGADTGVTVVDPEIAHEWAYIPHFYMNFYVFQYSTSFTASSALSEKVLAGDKVATKKYRDFLAAGGSKYPIELLKDAGVDMTTKEPLELTMKKMNRVMDEMEAILNKPKTPAKAPAKKK